MFTSKRSLGGRVIVAMGGKSTYCLKKVKGVPLLL